MDIFIIMPDHVHAVIVLDGIGRAQRSAPTDVGILDDVRNIKTYTTARYIQEIFNHH